VPAGSVTVKTASPPGGVGEVDLRQVDHDLARLAHPGVVDRNGGDGDGRAGGHGDRAGDFGLGQLDGSERVPSLAVVGECS